MATRTGSIRVEDADGGSTVSFGACAECGGEIGQRPVLSRRDHTTYLCAECGLTEALEGYRRYGE